MKLKLRRCEICDTWHNREHCHVCGCKRVMLKGRVMHWDTANAVFCWRGVPHYHRIIVNMLDGSN